MLQLLSNAIIPVENWNKKHLSKGAVCNLGLTDFFATCLQYPDLASQQGDIPLLHPPPPLLLPCHSLLPEPLLPPHKVRPAHTLSLALLWEGTRGVDSVGYTGTAMRRDLRSGHSRDGTERRLVELTCWGWHLITWRKNSEKSVIYSREHDTFYTLLVSEILFVPFQLCTPAKDISCGQSLFRCFFTRHLVSWGQG